MKVVMRIVTEVEILDNERKKTARKYNNPALLAELEEEIKAIFLTGDGRKEDLKLEIELVE